MLSKLTEGLKALKYELLALIFLSLLSLQFIAKPLNLGLIPTVACFAIFFLIGIKAKNKLKLQIVESGLLGATSGFVVTFIVSVFSFLFGMVAGASGAITRVSEAMASNPLVVIVALIIALVGASLVQAVLGAVFSLIGYVCAPSIAKLNANKGGLPKAELLVMLIFGTSIVILLWGLLTGNFSGVTGYVASLWAVGIIIRMMTQSPKKSQP